jgi:hypothetical protein
MHFLDYLRFHFAEALLGLVLGLGGACKALLYTPLPDSAVFSSPIPFLAIYWGLAITGVAILLRSIYRWNKHRVR